MTQTKEQEECPLCFADCTDPPAPEDTERARAFFSAWGLVGYGPTGDRNGSLSTADAVASFASALSAERNDRDRCLVAAFMCGISAVLHGRPSDAVQVMCEKHRPLVLDAMRYLEEQGEAVCHQARVRTTADAAAVSAAQAKRARKARR